MSPPPPLSHAYRPSDVAVVRATLSPELAREHAERRIRGRWQRPADGDLLTTIAEPRVVWVPYWRVAITLSGTMVWTYGPYTPRPEGGFWAERHVDGMREGGVAAVKVDGTTGYVMLCARRTPRLASFFATVEGTPPPWHVRADELVPRQDAGDILGPDPYVVDADVFPGMVHEEARRVCLRQIEKYKGHDSSVWKAPKVEGVITHFVLVPHYWVSYTYRGEAASPERRDGFFVAVHGRCRGVVGEEHPSTLRAVAGRLRRLLSLDRAALR